MDEEDIGNAYNLKPFHKQIPRANSNEYVLFNPTRSPARIMAKAISPTVDVMLSKPEFTSHQFRNIPVRPRRGVPHLENYCLFDPSKDFVSEKKAKNLEDDVAVDENEDLIEEIIYDDRLDIEDEKEQAMSSADVLKLFGSIEEANEVSSSVTSSTSGSNGTSLGTSSSTDSSGDLMQSSVIDISSSAHTNTYCSTPTRSILKKPTTFDISDSPSSLIYENDISLRANSSVPQLQRDSPSSVNSRDSEPNYVILQSERECSDRFARTGARPKSKYSDMDSGFLSPVSPILHESVQQAVTESKESAEPVAGPEEIKEYVQVSNINVHSVL